MAPILKSCTFMALSWYSHTLLVLPWDSHTTLALQLDSRILIGLAHSLGTLALPWDSLLPIVLAHANGTLKSTYSVKLIRTLSCRIETYLFINQVSFLMLFIDSFDPSFQSSVFLYPHYVCLMLHIEARQAASDVILSNVDGSSLVRDTRLQLCAYFNQSERSVCLSFHRFRIVHLLAMMSCGVLPC